MLNNGYKSGNLIFVKELIEQHLKLQPILNSSLATLKEKCLQHVHISLEATIPYTMEGIMINQSIVSKA
eukprot:9223501-Ditylum_brightwellii.AAC.1